MAIELLSKEILINAALMTRRPVAFLVGSPLSLRNGVGVPGVSAMLEFARDEVRDRGAFALSQYDAAVSGKTGADAYQAAMKWLGQNPGQDAVNDVIRKAVLQARRQDAGPVTHGTDGQPDEWNIPAGTTGLAELVARGEERFIGPILTTNFDPLLSLALRKSGRHAGRRVLTADGSLGGAAEDDPGTCSVVHLHGFWRDSETLHTQAQLTNARPRLKFSLQRLLVAQQRTLIVAAYGGWDDVFTQALVELVNDEQAKLDVIWCFYESDPVVVEQRYGKLLHAMEPAIRLNRFRPFGGIDCHSIFGEIHSTRLGTSSPAAVESFAASPIAGWQLIDSPFLDSLPPLDSNELIRYFDGAVPTWRHAVSGVIPKREGVEKLTARLAQIAHDNVARSMHLIRAAGGEGKSTLLFQAAADVARTGEWSVLSRSSPNEVISPEQIASLDASRRWLIVADDADGIVSDLSAIAEHIAQSGRNGVHFLLATRDADWKAAQGPRKPWSEWLDSYPDVLLRGITSGDAKAVLTAWESVGPGGLRELATIGDSAERAAVFEAAVRDAVGIQDEQARRRRPQEGSFFGGLLAVRFGQNGLQAHVRTFLERLEHMHIEHGSRNLFDALLYVAACHGTGIPGIDERVLADLVGVPREWVQRYVVRPLGEEAAAVYSAGHALTRHSQVAAAILVEAEETFGIDLAETWAELVRQTVQTSKNLRISRETYAKITHAGPRLQNALPPQIPEERRKAIAIRAARASSEAQPDRLSQLVDLAKTYRNAGEFEAAIKVFRDNHSTLAAKVDFRTDSPGYWNAWGTTESEAGKSSTHALANAWLCGLSISDTLAPAEITYKDVEMACSSFGLAFARLAEGDGKSVYAKGLRAAAFLGWKTNPHPSTARHFRIHDNEANKMQTPRPNAVDEAVLWLATSVAHVGRELQDPFLKALQDPEQVSFRSLLALFGIPHVSKETAEPRSRSNPLPAPPDDTKPIKLLSALDSRVQAGIERVLKEAWEAVPPATAPEDRLKLARQQAMRSISGLSPHIKKQVSSYFHIHMWKPLRSRDPQLT
jgi:hypothetical protein